MIFRSERLPLRAAILVSYDTHPRWPLDGKIGDCEQSSKIIFSHFYSFNAFTFNSCQVFVTFDYVRDLLIYPSNRTNCPGCVYRCNQLTSSPIILVVVVVVVVVVIVVSVYFLRW